MPSLVQVSLQRNAPGPWGLRLQGGVDFEKALVISHVTDGSPSNMSGLMTGDVIVEISGKDASSMTHKQAQEAIIACGNNVPLLVQRIVSQQPTPAWKPQVEVVGGPAVMPGVPGQTYTKTSLVASNVPDEDHWDVRHNFTAKGFQPSSNENPGFRSVSAPQTKPGHVPSGPPQIAQCFVCGQSIKGIFVMTKGRPACPQCFKCSSCSAELKNVGHVQVGDKLICTSCHKVPNGPNSNIQPPGPKPQSMAHNLAANLSKLANGKQQQSFQVGAAAGPPGSEWSQRLNADKAGMAGNAEDFTKEFMKQLTGQ